MQKAFLLVAGLCLMAAMCSGQASNGDLGRAPVTPGSETNSGAQTPASPGTRAQEPRAQGPSQTISGCLTPSSGGYTLVETQTGTVYQLSGNTRQFSGLLGHEMRLTGTAQNSVPNAQTGAPAGGAAKPVLFEVSAAREIGDQCGPASSTANGPH